MHYGNTEYCTEHFGVQGRGVTGIGTSTGMYTPLQRIPY